MTDRTVREQLAEDDPELLFADGFDDAIVGIVDRVGQDPFVVYDAARCIEILMREDPDMTHEQAEEHFEFNVARAWVGERTPAFVWMITEAADEDDE